MFSITVYSQLWSASWLIRPGWEIVSNRRLVSQAWRVNQLLQLGDVPLLLIMLPGRFINDRCHSSGSLSGKATSCCCSCLDNVFPRTCKQMQQPADGRGAWERWHRQQPVVGLWHDNDGRYCISLTDLAADCRWPLTFDINDDCGHLGRCCLLDIAGNSIYLCSINLILSSPFIMACGRDQSLTSI